VRVLASVIDYPPRARIGSFIALHGFLAALAEAGHHVTVLTAQRVRNYELDGVHVEHIDGMYYQRIRKCDVGISHLGDDKSLHKVCLTEGKPSVRLIHGTHDARMHDLLKHGEPTLVVYNSHSMAAEVGYTGHSIVCHPRLIPEDYRVERQFGVEGNITLVNLCEPKGGKVFSDVARWLPERKFLGVKGGYGKQVDIHRSNVTVIPATAKMRDDVYAHTDILVMPSEHETWGMVAAEAMCSGIPVIAHPTPGLVECLGEAGIFCDRDDTQQWLAAIEALGEWEVKLEAISRSLERAAELAADDSASRFVDAVERLV